MFMVFLATLFLFTIIAFGTEVPKATITIDGDQSDWSGISPLIVDDINDSEADETGTDIKNVYLAKDSCYLFVRFDFKDADPNKNILYHLNFQYGQGDTNRYEIVMFFSDNEWIVELRFDRDNNYQWVLVYTDSCAVGNKLLEARVCLNKLGTIDNSSIMINAHIFSETFGKQQDDTAWVHLTNSEGFADGSGCGDCIDSEPYSDSDSDSDPYNLIKISANQGSGFFWPYYLSIPSTVGNSSTLLVIPNNTGTADDDPAVHDAAARQYAIDWSGFAGNLKSPLLIPTFPRPFTEWWIYTHALDRDTLLTDIVELKRIDLQLLAMIDDAIDRLLNMKITVENKILMMGFSASAQFTSRFSAIHPHRIKAAAIGAPGYPIVPVDSWKGNDLRYCVGVSDLFDLTGLTFDSGIFKSIPMYFFVGDQDTNDPVAFDDGFDQEDRDLIYTLFGNTIIGRWPKIQEVYDTVGCDSDFVVYSGVGHDFTTQMINDIEIFFKEIQGIDIDGDVAPLGNRDGTVDVDDALVALRFALTLETPTAEDIAHGDVAPLDTDNQPNPDGEITVGDALVILRKALGLVSWICEGIENNAPSTKITFPDNGTILSQSQSITFIGSGNDTEDGTLSGNSLIWTSSLDGQIGTGTNFTKNYLTVGQHTITLTATDSKGTMGAASVTIKVDIPKQTIFLE